MQQRSEETRNSILEAAYILFAQSGYEATGVAEICAQAGVSKGAFYYHFPSKQAVFLDLMDQWLVGLDAAFTQALQQTPDVSQAILQMADMASNVLEAANVRLSIILEFWMQAYRDQAIWQAAIAPYHRYQAYFAGLIRQGMDEGSFKETDPELVARVIVSLAMGLLMQFLFEPEAVNWVEETRRSLEVLMNGMKRSL